VFDHFGAILVPCTALMTTKAELRVVHIAISVPTAVLMTAVAELQALCTTASSLMTICTVFRAAWIAISASGAAPMTELRVGCTVQ
jgi:hypothetical protein